MSALVTAMLAHTAAPWTLPATRGPCSGSVMSHAAAACCNAARCSAVGGAGTLAGVTTRGTLRERHAMVGQTLLLGIREPPGDATAPPTPPTPARGRSGQATRLRRLAERRTLLVGRWRRPLAGIATRGTLRERHALVGQTLLLGIRELRTVQAGHLARHSYGPEHRHWPPQRRRHPRRGRAASATNPTTIPILRGILFAEPVPVNALSSRLLWPSRRGDLPSNDLRQP